MLCGINATYTPLNPLKTILVCHHSLSRCWLPNLQNSDRIWTYSRSRSPILVSIESACDHRLRSSASPVLTATNHSCGSPRLSEFFPPQP